VVQLYPKALGSLSAASYDSHGPTENTALLLFLTVPLLLPLIIMIIINTAPAAVGISLNSVSGRYRALLGEVREND
jgi:hypothetical protein